MTMRNIDINATLKLDDGDYLIVEVAGSLYRLRNLATGQYVVVPNHALPSRLLEPVERLRANPRELETIEDHERDELNFWAQHLRELDTGRKTATSEIRPDYDPSRGANQRIESKLKELEALGHGVARSTLLRKRKKFKEGGVTALIDGRELRQETPLDKADARLIEALRESIAAQATKSTRTALGVIADAIKVLRERYPGEEIKVPSEATLYRYFNYISTGKYTTGSASNRRSRSSVTKRSIGETRKYFPGQYVEIDSTVIDVPVYDEEGNVARPTLTIMVDVCTRSIVAHSFRVSAAKAVDHAFLLAQALTPRRQRPNADEQWRSLLHRFPWVDLVDADARDQLDDTRPFIGIDSITVDHGTDYTGTVFEAACDLYGISLLYSAPGTPVHKNHVERTFDTIKRGFVEHLDAFTGGSVEHRGDIDDAPLLDLVSLDQMFDEWVTRVYQNSPHSGLTDPFRPKTVLSPNEMYAATFDLSPAIPVPMDATDYISLLPAQRRTIQPQGIQYQNRFYDCPELQVLRNSPPRMDSSGKPVNDWEFRANPYDPRAIWVAKPDRTWLECPWLERNAVYQPHQAAVWAEANRIVKANPDRLGGLNARLLTLEILSQTKTNEVTTAKLRMRNKAATKMAGVGGVPFPEPQLSLGPAPAFTERLDDIDNSIDYYEGEEL
jgi:transposase InsO family protein